MKLLLMGIFRGKYPSSSVFIQCKCLIRSTRRPRSRSLWIKSRISADVKSDPVSQDSYLDKVIVISLRTNRTVRCPLHLHLDITTFISNYWIPSRQGFHDEFHRPILTFIRERMSLIHQVWAKTVQRNHSTVDTKYCPNIQSIFCNQIDNKFKIKHVNQVV